MMLVCFFCKVFYFFDIKGKLLEKRENPSDRAYQDCEMHYGHLVCSGGGSLDFINLDSWKIVKEFKVEKSLEGSKLTREGMSILENKVFFLPDDGKDARIYIYEFSDEKVKK